MKLDPKALARIVTHNWRLKLFSLIVSCLLFFFVSYESSTVVETEIPIVYDTAADIRLMSDAPRNLLATMKGPWASFRNLSELNPLVIDLKTAEPGTMVHRIEASDIEAPAGMRIISVRPSEIEISLDRLVGKLVAVEVDPLGRPAFGFEIVEMRADPPRVRVEGPLSKIRTVDFVHSRPVDLRDLDEDLEVEVELRPPSPPVYIVGRNSVRVFVDVTEEVSQRSIELPVRVEGAPEGTRVRPESVAVTLKGPRRFVDRLNREDLDATIDVSAAVAEGAENITGEVAIAPMPDRTKLMGAAPTVSVSLPKRRD